MAEEISKQYKHLLVLISNINDSHLTGIVTRYTYVLQPFVESLGYNVYDFDQVTMKPEIGNIRAKVTGNIMVSFTLDGTKVEEDPEAKIRLILDLDNNVMTLLFKTLDRWRKVLSMKLENTQRASQTFDIIYRYVSPGNLKGSLESNGERLLSDGVLATELATSNLNNDFVKTILLSEITHPSDAFIHLIAHDLKDKYSIDKESNIYSQLYSIINGDGTSTMGLTKLLGLKEVDDSKNNQYNGTTAKTGATKSRVANDRGASPVEGMGKLLNNGVTEPPATDEPDSTPTALNLTSLIDGIED